MFVLTHQGLFCKAGNFYVDPKGSVENAVITHAHSDHARRGAKKYYCVRSGLELLKARLGPNISVETRSYSQKFFLNDVTVSFHPAGHILGSSQVRVEYGGEVWVISGDYKRSYDPTCEPFESVPCDVFITEATFGTPAYRWKKNQDIGKEIFQWWSENAQDGHNSLLFAYSLGKSQRILGVLKPFTQKPIYCHSTITPMTDCYRAQDIPLAPTVCLQQVKSKAPLQGELFLAPQSFLKTEQAALLGENYKTAFASGWMAKTNYGYDKGFLMSDHADWDELLLTIKESKAKRVYVQHRGNGALVRHLNQIGICAFPDSALIQSDSPQLSFF